MDLLIFSIDERHYGLPVAVVAELFRAVSIVPLPKAPPVVEGVINMRGTVIPVVDLRHLLQLPAKPIDPDDIFIVAKNREQPLALRVDAVHDLVQVAATEVQEPSSIAPGVQYLAGIAKWQTSLVLIHDLAAYLSHKESTAMAAALAAQAAEVAA